MAGSPATAPAAKLAGGATTRCSSSNASMCCSSSVTASRGQVKHRARRGGKAALDGRVREGGRWCPQAEEVADEGDPGWQLRLARRDPIVREREDRHPVVRGSDRGEGHVRAGMALVRERQAGGRRRE